MALSIVVCLIAQFQNGAKCIVDTKCIPTVLIKKSEVKNDAAACVTSAKMAASPLTLTPIVSCCASR
jgi:hypothetical protein